MSMKEEFKQLVLKNKLTNKETLDFLYNMILETFDHATKYCYDKGYDDGKHDRLPDHQTMRTKFWKADENV